MHRNAPLTPEGRLRLCRLIEEGWTGRHGGRVDADLAADGPQVVAPLPRGRPCRPGGSLQPASALPDQDPGQGRAPGRRAAPSAPARPGPSGAERRNARLDAAPDLAASRGRAGSPTSSAGRGRVVRRIETSRPGELVHIDIKKQAKIPPGGGWRVNGRRKRRTRQRQPTSARLRPRPLGHRRLQPPGLLRGPRRRAASHEPLPSGVGPRRSSRATASPSSG